MKRKPEHSKNEHSEHGKPVTGPIYAWSPWVRAAVSLVIAMHILAVFSAPFSSPPPSSELSRSIAQWFEPWLFGAFLNHGYRFFAPNPGPSHLVEYELKFADGRTEKGRFPDLDEQWPRLLYHRYLILSEIVNEHTNPQSIPPQPQRPPPFLPPGVKQRALQQFEDQQKARKAMLKRRDLLLDGIASCLLAESGAEKVHLWSVEHQILPPEAIEFGERIDAEDSFVKRDLGEFPRK